MPFTYPNSPHVRRHSPAGYADYSSFKPWLRDEFQFRCIFCLVRERMCPNGQDAFSVEHLLPRSTHPHLTCAYTNLVYACSKCNSNKNDRGPVLDPCRSAYATHLALARDGTIQGTTREGKKLVRLLRLDREELNEFRKRTMRLVRAAHHNPGKQWAREVLAWLTYPADMPDLRTCRPPSNALPESAQQCYFVQREQGRLQRTY
jgi:hypothetical protein